MPLLDFLYKRADTEDQEILRAYNEMVQPLPRTGIRWSDRQKIFKAYELAKLAHQDQRRKSGEPYIFHPIAVARILVWEVGLYDPVTIQCALLHDVVEDSDFSLDNIEERFGPKVREIIDGLTKIRSTSIFSEENSAQAQNFRKILLTISHDIRVIVVKLADRLHNMRTLGSMREDKALKITSETLYLYAPLANRLGLHPIKSELENLAFRHGQPDRYAEIDRLLQDYQEKKKDHLDDFTKKVKAILDGEGYRYEMTSRYKTPYSIYKKMERQGIAFEDIYDIFALRIILKTGKNVAREREVGLCWEVYTRLVAEPFVPHTGRLRDWITRPKENGYESLHITLRESASEAGWVEVQLRTERMDREAEQGLAAHWRYKDGDWVDEELRDWIEEVRVVLNDSERDLSDRMQEVQDQLRPRNVHVLTPQNEVKRLPTGATVLDFAYDIHSEIGNHAMGAKVNHRVQPIDYVLASGDQVEVLTSKRVHPEPNWIYHATTSKAKTQIQRALARRRRRNTQTGERLFRIQMRRFGVEHDQQFQRELLAYLKYAKLEEFFHDLGARSIDIQRLEEFVHLKEQGKALAEADIEEWEKKIRLREQEYREMGVKLDDELVLPDGKNISDYRFAKCCKPVGGDNIMGVMRSGDVLEIHRLGCQHATHLMSNYGNRIVKVRWGDGMRNINFLVSLKVIGVDRYGMLADLIQVITKEFSLNIAKVTIEGQDRMFEGMFNVYINTPETLERLVTRLEKLDNVVSVSRSREEF